MAKKPPPPIFEVAKKQAWIDKFTTNPELKQQVSALECELFTEELVRIPGENTLRGNDLPRM